MTRRRFYVLFWFGFLITISTSIFSVFFFAQQLSQQRVITTFDRPPFSKCGVAAQEKSQPRSTFVAQHKLNDVEPCIIGLTVLLSRLVLEKFTDQYTPEAIFVGDPQNMAVFILEDALSVRVDIASGRTLLPLV